VSLILSPAPPRCDRQGSASDPPGSSDRRRSAHRGDVQLQLVRRHGADRHRNAHAGIRRASDSAVCCHQVIDPDGYVTDMTEVAAPTIARPSVTVSSSTTLLQPPQHRSRGSLWRTSTSCPLSDTGIAATIAAARSPVPKQHATADGTAEPTDTKTGSCRVASLCSGTAKAAPRQNQPSGQAGGGPTMACRTSATFPSTTW
jgi:hypothetical protein